MVTNIIGFKNINLAKGPKATFCGCQILDVSIWRMSNIAPVQPQIKHSEATLVDILGDILGGYFATFQLSIKINELSNCSQHYKIEVAQPLVW